MKFYIDYQSEQNTLKDILKELANQYANNFNHVGTEDFKSVIKPNLELLLIVIEELKDDSHLEYSWNDPTLKG
jgi:uncharacterized Fe-S radical SAM superfamily protein PflX